MATKGSALSRTLSYFKTADYDEARVAFQLVNETMQARKNISGTLSAAAPKAKKTWSRRKKTVPAAAPPETQSAPQQETASAA